MKNKLFEVGFHPKCDHSWRINWNKALTAVLCLKGLAHLLSMLRIDELAA